jgi:Arc/MetJ-type ribon-helix-helix transcriptional regulator
VLLPFLVDPREVVRVLLRLLLGDVMASDVRFAALRIDVETNAQTICPSVRVDPKKLGRTPNAPELSRGALVELLNQTAWWRRRLQLLVRHPTLLARNGQPPLQRKERAEQSSTERSHTGTQRPSFPSVSDTIIAPVAVREPDICGASDAERHSQSQCVCNPGGHASTSMNTDGIR